MNYFIQKIMKWMKLPDYNDPVKNLSAMYVQTISILLIVSASILGIVYAFEGQLFYVSMTALGVFIFAMVIALVRLGKLWIASNLFLIIALGLLSFGIFATGGIHASSSLLYPAILVFASLLLNRKSYIVYGLFCVVSIGIIIFAENQGLTPVPYVPDPPNFPLFLTYALVVITTGSVIRSITENLQNSSLQARQYSQELLIRKVMLDRVGQAVIGCELDDTIIYWNHAAEGLYGWTADEALGNKYYDQIPTDLTSEMEDEIWAALQRGDVWSGELKVRNKDQATLHVLGSVAPIQDENRTVTGWIGIAADLTERRHVETALRQREAILEADTFAAEQFLKTPDWRENINIVLERLGKTINATHAYLFEDHTNPQGQPVTSMRYEWTAPGYPSDLGGPYFQSSPIDQEGFEDQVEKLRRGEVRSGTSSTFGSVEKQVMQNIGVKSILEVPVFVHGREWGAIGFDDVETEREWSPAEVDALKIAAGVLGAAIQRRDAESAVQESERIYRQAIQAMGAIPYYLDYLEHRYTFIGDAIEDVTGYTPSEITPQNWEEMELERFPRGRMAHLTYEEADRLTEEGHMRHWECDYLILNRRGEKRWVSDASIQVLDDKNVRVGVVGIIQDITDRKLTEAGLRDREALLESVTFSAEQFLRAADWRVNIEDVLERLGKTINATHAYLFEQHLGSNHERLDTLRYEWTAPGHESDLEVSAFQNVPLFEVGFEEYDATLQSGNPFIGNLSSFRPAERERFSSLGIKAILEVPLFVNGQWWGTIGFDDMDVERQWTVAEVDALKIAGGILSATIQRQDAESAVQESEQIYRQAIEAAGAVPYYQDYKIDKYKFMGQGIQSITGYAPDEMSSSLWDSIVKEYAFVGDLKGIDPDEAVLMARKGELNHWKCDYHILSRDGQYKWIADAAIELFDESGISYASIGILQDISERKQIETDLRKRESLLQAVTFAAEQFLKLSDWRNGIDAVLERLGGEFHASHAYLFENHWDHDGSPLHSMRYEWTAPGQKSDLDDPSYQNMPETETMYSHYEILNSGEPYIGRSSTFTDEEREHFSDSGIKALLELRIVVAGKQWGTLGFDDMENEREWTPFEVDVIRVAANVLSAAIKRQVDEDALKRELAERKRTELALRLSEEKFSKAFHNAHVLTTIEDEDHILVDVNNAFLNTFGLERDQVIGRSVPDLNILYAVDDLYALRRAYQESGGLRDFEMRIRRKEGEMGFVVLSTEKLNLDNVEYTLTTGPDITERKLVEIQIQQQAARAEALAALSQLLTNLTQDQYMVFDSVVRRCAELIGDGASIFLYSPDNEFLELMAVYNADPNAMDIFRDEMNKHPIRWNEGAYAEAIGENRPVLIPFIPIEKLIENASPERKEYYQKLPIHSMMLAPLHVRGNVMGVIGMARHSPGRDYTPQDLTFLQDIADRSALAMLNAQYYGKLEQELAERKRAEEKYRDIFNNSIDGIFQSTEDGHFLSVNPAMARIYGYDSPEDMLDSVKDIGAQLYVNAENRDEVRRRLNADEKLTGYELLDYHKDGTAFWASMTAQAIRDENGKVLYYEGTIEDITLRKKAEAEREALIQELAGKNAELEQFTYTVSHDLKSPLVTINGFIGYLEQDAASGNMERLKKDTQRIQEAVQKMQRLLNELLELSRIGRMMNAPEKIPFEVLVDDAINIVHGQITERGVAVQKQPNLPVTYGDRPRLVEVLQNLIDNAVKYMGDQSNPQIEVGQRGNENNMPVFYVKDNGMGIEAEHHERVFGLFNKLDARSEGTGVGLALVKRIVEVHGGRIWVESEPGKGATFLFTLPTGPEA